MADELTCAEAVRRMREAGWLEMPLAHDRSVQVGRYGEGGDRREVDIFEFGIPAGDCWLTPDQARVLASALLGVDVEAMERLAEAAVTWCARAGLPARFVDDRRAQAHNLEAEALDELNAAVQRYLAGQEAGGG